MFTDPVTSTDPTPVQTPGFPAILTEPVVKTEPTPVHAGIAAPRLTDPVTRVEPTPVHATIAAPKFTDPVTRTEPTPTQTACDVTATEPKFSVGNLLAKSAIIYPLQFLFMKLKFVF